MCCLFAILVLIGPRAAILVWWLVDQLRWAAAFDTFIWPLLGFLFLPWTTLVWVLVFPGGIDGFDWLWLAIGLAIDIAVVGRRRGQPVPGDDRLPVLIAEHRPYRLGRRSQRSRVSPRTRAGSPDFGPTVPVMQVAIPGPPRAGPPLVLDVRLGSIRGVEPRGPAVRHVVEAREVVARRSRGRGRRSRPGAATRGRSRARRRPSSASAASRRWRSTTRRCRRGSRPGPTCIPRPARARRVPSAGQSTIAESNSPGRPRWGSSSGARPAGSAHQPAADPGQVAQRAVGHDRGPARDRTLPSLQRLDGGGDAVEHREIGRDLVVAHDPASSTPAGACVERGHDEEQQAPARRRSRTRLGGARSTASGARPGASTAPRRATRPCRRCPGRSGRTSRGTRR